MCATRFGGRYFDNRVLEVADEASGNRAAISLLCGLNGLDFHLARRDFAARCRGAGWQNEPSAGFLRAER
jgi:hypothetical protein